MLDFSKLEEIIDKFREELTLANRSGEEELNAFLTKHNISLEKEKTCYSYCDIGNSQILIVGNLNIQIKDVNGICKNLGIDPNRLVYVSYDEATNYPFDNLRYSNKYSDIIFGAIPHKGKGIDGFSSIITYLESNASEFPNVIRATNSNELNLNKTQIKNALIKTRFYKEVLEG